MTVLLVDHALHFLLHNLNTKLDVIHLAVEAPKVAQNLVVLLDGLELHGSGCV